MGWVRLGRGARDSPPGCLQHGPHQRGLAEPRCAPHPTVCRTATRPEWGS